MIGGAYHYDLIWLLSALTISRTLGAILSASTSITTYPVASILLP